MPAQSLTQTYLNRTGGVVSTTYAELSSLLLSSSASPGTHYLITDYITTYDMPDYYWYDIETDLNSPKLGITASVAPSLEPLVVYATSNSELHPYAYSTIYPQDEIIYNWAIDQTEVSGASCTGRIEKRTSPNTDTFPYCTTHYDWRNIQFIRYKSYDQGATYPGTISFDFTTYGATSQALITGSGLTTFTSITPGSLIYVPGPIVTDIGTLKYFIFVSGTVSDNQHMYASLILSPGGTSNYPLAGPVVSSAYYVAQPTSVYSHYAEQYAGQHVAGDYTLYDTFNTAAVGNYVGNSTAYYASFSDPFVLPNSVFISQTIAVKTGDYFKNNTVISSAYRTTFGNFCRNNILDTVTDTTFGDNVHSNKMQKLDSCQLGDDFQHNNSWGVSLTGANFGINVVSNNLGPIVNSTIPTNFFDLDTTAYSIVDRTVFTDDQSIVVYGATTSGAENTLIQAGLITLKSDTSANKLKLNVSQDNTTNQIEWHIGSNSGALFPLGVTSTPVWRLQDASGTIAFLSDIVLSAGNLQTVLGNGATASYSIYIIGPSGNSSSVIGLQGADGFLQVVGVDNSQLIALEPGNSYTPGNYPTINVSGAGGFTTKLRFTGPFTSAGEFFLPGETSGTLLYSNNSFNGGNVAPKIWAEVHTDSGAGLAEFYLSHGLGATPTVANVTAASVDAAGNYYITAIGSTCVEIKYLIAPLTGSSNLSWHMLAYLNQ